MYQDLPVDLAQAVGGWRHLHADVTAAILALREATREQAKSLDSAMRRGPVRVAEGGPADRACACTRAELYLVNL